MIRDRGRIKWNSLMLPEHVKMLRGWADEDTEEQQKQLDEQKLEWLNETAREAMAFEKEVIINHFANNHYEKMEGRIRCFDALQKEFRIVDRTGDIKRISVENIEQMILADE
ncbi:YolD-like family protein [Lederbergia citrea]|uniref:YolD-like family protein n=1 Tax=Lederbergia citrea TaxID=2833581 RepID=A0A942UJ07_9BACI|nr:YolD-like family protein [Lederbergia citrea]MBS4176427.1 YolD-like family protein [Lederbergia citrea]MBS4202988.1 YolD-like family protein [Lederbergia citrea]MBS4222340.1 YolD-like family protein [Lederbergia citrea]